MSLLLDDVIKQGRTEAAEYEDFLRRAWVAPRRLPNGLTA